MNDRIGEIEYNQFGSKMIIVEYRNYDDIDVYFPEYDWVAKHRGYNKFKLAKNIKCPYEPRYYNKAFDGCGVYNYKNDKRAHDYWCYMIRRCYEHEKNLRYEDCEVCEEWHNFQNFAKWFYENYYEIEGEKMGLDKDILHKNNKVYSPSTCIFTPSRINTLFIKNNKNRGELPIGVRYHKDVKKYSSHLSIKRNGKSKQVYLGLSNTPEEAFHKYKIEKEKYIKEVADEYKDKIPYKLYEAMYKWEVDIND